MTKVRYFAKAALLNKTVMNVDIIYYMAVRFTGSSENEKRS